MWDTPIQQVNSLQLLNFTLFPIPIPGPKAVYNLSQLFLAGLYPVNTALQDYIKKCELLPATEMIFMYVSGKPLTNTTQQVKLHIFHMELQDVKFNEKLLGKLQLVTLTHVTECWLTIE